MFQIAWTQLLVFVITIIVVLMVDLLVGIAAGIVAEFIVNLASGGKVGSLFVAKAEIEVHGTSTRIKLRDSLTFSNYLSLKSKISKAQAKSSHIILDMEGVNYIDHTVMANLTSLQADLKMLDKMLKFEHLDKLAPATSHPLAPRRASKGGGVSPLTNNLSRRQLELLVVAVEHHLDFLPEEWEEHDHWATFPSTVGRKIDRVSSVFVKKGHGFRITCADLKLSTGALLTYESNESTFMRINFKSHSFPTFSLTRESSMDKVAERLGAQDIDFADFPTFSDTFLLQGDDEAAIRTFFTADILRFHEQHPDIFVESTGNAILAYKAGSLLNFAEIEALIEFGKQWGHLVTGHADHHEAASESEKTMNN